MVRQECARGRARGAVARGVMGGGRSSLFAQRTKSAVEGWRKRARGLGDEQEDDVALGESVRVVGAALGDGEQGSGLWP